MKFEFNPYEIFEMKGGGFGRTVSPRCDSHLLREDAKFRRRKDAKKINVDKVLNGGLLYAEPRQDKFEISLLGDIKPSPEQAAAAKQSAVEAESKPAEKETQSEA